MRRTNCLLAMGMVFWLGLATRPLEPRCTAAEPAARAAKPTDDEAPPEPDEKAADAPPAFEPTANYEVVEIEGWKLFVNRRLRPGGAKAELGEQALQLARLQLFQIIKALPPRQVKALRQVPIWLDDDPKNQIHYHPDRQWLVDNGFNPDRAKCVDIGRTDHFWHVYREQPFVLLHELAHAYHDRVLDFDDPRVIRAFEQARDSKSYDEVLKIQGRKGRHYALTNHKEYFAESTESFLGTNDFFPFVRAELEQHDPTMYRLLTEIWLTDVQPPPDSVRRAFGLNRVYEKHVDVGGFPVIGSAKVRDEALLEAAFLIERMLEGRDDIRRAMIGNRTRFVVMATSEWTTDVPEHSDLEPKNYWDRRARGLGATKIRPAVSCGEENLIGCPGDPYSTENILVHEFAHAIHDMGLKTLDREFDRRLKGIFDQAMADGLWKAKYASSNHHEYWAEGVQSYFGTNRENDHDHNHVDTREELKEYDPRLFAIIDEVFQQNPWQYRKPTERKHTAHLAGLDATSLPTFEWPERLAEESAKLKRLKEEKLKEAEE